MYHRIRFAASTQDTAGRSGREESTTSVVIRRWECLFLPSYFCFDLCFPNTHTHTHHTFNFAELTTAENERGDPAIRRWMGMSPLYATFGHYPPNLQQQRVGAARE